MLELRPNCEWCDRNLPPDAAEARICTYECTYCAGCVENVLKNVCLTCGGGFVPRPIRPQIAYHDVPALGLGNQSASTVRVHSRWTVEQLKSMTNKLRDIAPSDH